MGAVTIDDEDPVEVGEHDPLPVWGPVRLEAGTRQRRLVLTVRPHEREAPRLVTNPGAIRRPVGIVAVDVGRLLAEAGLLTGRYADGEDHGIIAAGIGGELFAVWRPGNVARARWSQEGDDFR